MTPAETLAAKKSRRRLPRKGGDTKHLKWHCGIRQLRRSLGITLRDVSKVCSLSHTALWQIEMGGDVRLTTAVRLAAFFGKTVEEIWSPLERLTPKEATGE